MQFLRTLFWIVLVVLLMLFAFNNWTPVTVNLWSGLQLDSKLPVLLIATFLIGLVPPLLLHRATRWRMRKRIESAERALADTRALGDPAPIEPVIQRPMPPAAVPTAVPPGVA